MRSHYSRMLTAAALSAVMLCNTVVCAWATTTDAATAQDAAVIKTALASGLEANGQKPELPRLLPSETKIKSVGRVLEKDIPLFFDPTEESNVYILLPLDAIVSVMEDLGDWFRVSYNDCTGFIPPEYIELLKYDEAFETYGVVDAEEMSLLEEADGSSEVLATLKDGDRVEVTGLENGYFAVKSGDKTGYVTGDDLDLTMEKEAPAPKVTVKAANKTTTAAKDATTEDSAAEGSTDTVVSSGSGSDIVSFAMQYLGTPYAYGGTGSGGFDCSGFTMHVFSNFGVSLAHGATPQLNNGYAVSQSELQPGDLVFFFGTYNTSSAASHVGSDIVSFAMQYLGTPYAYGGTGSGGFDCSGFTMHVFSNFGVSLAHGATPQLNNGYAVSQSELQPGDLVFFFGTYNTSSAASHVGIYIGGGQFIHASTSRGVIISSLSESYYASRYLSARRVF